MEPDSTTLDNNHTILTKDKTFPFRVSSENLLTYNTLISEHGTKVFSHQIVTNLQELKLLPTSINCLSYLPECQMIVKAARVIDKVQWVCAGCGKRQSIRTGSFFLRIPCSLLQSLQIILSWCEDADLELSAQYFDVKPKVVGYIYDKLDELSVREQSKYKLGGNQSVVLTEMYPDCLNRLSPDTTDQSHVHRILMMADTNHIPTSYKFHVIMGDAKKMANMNSQMLKTELETVISNATLSNSFVVSGSNVPPIDGTTSLQHLVDECDAEMRHFCKLITSRIWRQAINLCAASRDFCASEPLSCSGAAQRYLNAASYRRRLPTDFYRHVLRAISDEYTEN